LRYLEKMSKKLTYNIIPDEVIINKIYFIRGIKVMLDRDLAQMYEVKPFRMREQVKRNEDIFPEHFMFRLTKSEMEIMVSQNAIPSKKHLGGSLPYVFTEHGILQLANVLKSKSARQMSIRIIEVFVKMTKMLSTHKDILMKLEQLEKHLMKHDEHYNKHEEEIQTLFIAIRNLIEDKKQRDKPRKRIGYKQLAAK